MSAVREKTQADFDLERVMDLFDSALTSKDERVVNALRQLLMITALTAPESNDDIMDQRNGPFRRLQENLNDLYRRLNTVENEMNNMRRQPYNPGAGNPYPMGPYVNPGSPNPYSPNWGIDPNMPYTTSKASSSYIPPGPFTLTDNEKDSTMNIKLTK
jgi:hypothetical protein